MQSDCPFSAADTFAYGVAGVSRFRLAAGSGKVRIEGRKGDDVIRVTASRCASRREVLENLWFNTVRSNEELAVEVRTPHELFSPTVGTVARIDFRIEVPEGMSIEVAGGTGGVGITRTGGVTLEGSLGDVTLEEIRGNVVLTAGPGTVRVRDVEGSAVVEVSTGRTAISVITGDVHLLARHQASGEIERVGGTVTIGEGSAGALRVAEVGGDLVIGKTGRLEIEHSGVRGRVIKN